MLPDWLDWDRLQALLVVVAVVATILALVGLALLRGPVRKALAVVLLGLVAAGAVWQTRALDDARRADCADVEVLGARVVVPSCPRPSA
jgi:hypothetical protein